MFSGNMEFIVMCWKLVENFVIRLIIKLNLEGLFGFSCEWWVYWVFYSIIFYFSFYIWKLFKWKELGILFNISIVFMLDI